jgi:hypothetical protein
MQDAKGDRENQALSAMRPRHGTTLDSDHLIRLSDIRKITLALRFVRQTVEPIHA